MDGIDSIGAPQTMVSLGAVATAGGVENATSETVADMSDLKKQQLAKDFESVLLTRLFNEVKESIGSAGFGEDVASDQIHGMFWSYLAQDIGSKGGFGLWQDLYQHFKDLEGGAAATGTLTDEGLRA